MLIGLFLFLWSGSRRAGGGSAHGDLFEAFGDVDEGLFEAHAFEGGSADEPVAIGVFLDVSGIFGRADRAAVAEEDEVFADFFGGDDDALSAGDGVVKAAGGAFDADG